ncbi:MAG: GPW/gp25 family protein [Bacteroidota bacterium]
METDKILGTGWAFPPSFDREGLSPQMLTGVADVENSIQVILHTKIGERIMRTTFGTAIHELLFEPMSAEMKTYMAATLSESLQQHEPRINVTNLVLEQQDPNDGQLNIHVAYLIAETQTPGNLVVPYTIPENI